MYFLSERQKAKSWEQRVWVYVYAAYCARVTEGRKSREGLLLQDEQGMTGATGRRIASEAVV